MSLKLTTNYHKINQLTKPVRLISGSQGSSKTYSIIEQLLEHGLSNPNSIITCITDTYPHLVDGMLIDIANIYTLAGLDFSTDYNISKKNLTLHNGSVMQFRNLDNKDLNAGRGPRRSILFVNEANRMGYPALKPFITRTNLYKIFDWNPSEPCWIDEQYIDNESQANNVDHITVTYDGNEFIPDGERQELEEARIESEKPGAPESLIQWVRTFVHGLKGNYSERQIYNYSVIDEIPTTAERIPSGMDFGVSPDKTSLVNIYHEGRNLYFDEVFCLNNLRPETIPGDQRMSIANKLDEIEFPKGRLIVADSSGRVSILDLRNEGYTVQAVAKPPGSVKWGIIKMRGYKIHITRRSENLKKDFDNFLWRQDPYTGNIIPEPDPKIHEGDSLVACRYVVMSYFQ